MDLLEINSSTLNQRHPWELARANFFSHILRSCLSWNTPVSVLDVGSGDGWLGQHLLRSLPNHSSLFCWDNNYTPEIVSELKKTSNPNVVFQNNLPKEKYDLILMMDVLEHIENDQDFLATMVASNLADNGTILLSVPAWNFLYTSHDKFLKHFRRYSPSQARIVVKSCGTQIYESGCIFHSLLYIRICEKFLEKLGLCKKVSHLGTWGRGMLITNVVSSILQLENRIILKLSKLGIFLPGLSWWAILKKRS